MSELPVRLTNSGLWRRVAEASHLLQAIISLREVVESLAAKISEQLPEFTDHSIKHFDALWWVADEVITRDEMQKMSIGEAFVLGCALYLHDLGMAAAATQEGAQRLKVSSEYRNAAERLQRLGMAPETAASNALRYAARDLHASISEQLASEIVPGLDRYLIEHSEIRLNWGRMIGQTAHSHHWSLPELDRRIGLRGRMPDCSGDPVDLGYVACLLRVIDYAHISMDRAPRIERALRPQLPSSSEVHWDAQEHITGPMREGNQLVYGAREGISSVDGWWTFFEMASGLDAEISSVHEYLNSRAASVGRFSLDGVKGVRSPQTFSVQVPTEGFDPVDVRFRAQSMGRLIQLLGGRTLYGVDQFAAVRELLQNAIDALSICEIELANANVDSEPLAVRVAVERVGRDWSFTVSDNGIGMSTHVVTTYLLGIATDYWSSAEYFSEHPEAANSGFRPIGRFGIGFLSVFMLGDEIEVETQRRGGQRLHLRIRGVGQRGSLEKRAPTYQNGTIVRVRLSPDFAQDLVEELPRIVLAKAPMLRYPVMVSTPGGETVIRPGWWRKVTQEELSEFLSAQPSESTTPKRLRASTGIEDIVRGRVPRLREAKLAELDSADKWPQLQPEAMTESSRILAVPGMGGILLCSKGFSIGQQFVRGLVGLVDIGEQELDAARSKVLSWESDESVAGMRRLLRPQIVHALDSLVDEGDVPGRYQFLNRVARQHGIDLLLETALPWITVREPPGNAVLMDIATFVSKAAAVDEVLVVYGSGHWEAEFNARRVFPQSTVDSLVTVVSDAGQPTPGSYEDEREIIDGPLSEHFKGRRHKEDEDPQSACLLQATLRAIAKAWNQEPAELTCIWRRHNQVLYGRLLASRG